MTYLISGKERKKMKKKLSILKRAKKMFWYFEDVHRVYGCGMTDAEAENLLNTYDDKIKEFEFLLNQNK